MIHKVAFRDCSHFLKPEPKSRKILLRSYDLAPRPPPRPTLTVGKARPAAHRKPEKERQILTEDRGSGRRRSQIIRRRESLVLYKKIQYSLSQCKCLWFCLEAASSSQIWRCWRSISASQKDRIGDHSGLCRLAADKEIVSQDWIEVLLVKEG
jgi:hypothetical protein